jgi:hypothetical protein
LNGETLQTEDELSRTTFEIYLFLVKAGKPYGPREIMRVVNISSPGVVHRHLQKLADLGWVQKDAYGSYSVKEKVGFRGHVWIGKRLVARSVLFALGFTALAITWVAVLGLHLWIGSPIDQSFTLLTVVTAVAAGFLLLEALRPRKRTPNQAVPI